MEENSLPEEKLLKLIRGQNNFPSAIEKKAVNDVEVEKVQPALDKAIQWFSFMDLSFFQIQRVLLLGLLLSCIYLIVSFIYPLTGKPKVKITDIPLGQSQEPDPGLNIEVKPSEFYLKGITGRQVFKNSIASIDNVENARPLNNVPVDVTKDIKLIGIVQKDSPQAIIEDQKTQKTYYLNKGQFLGELQVEAIEEDKVIINFKDQKFELYL